MYHAIRHATPPTAPNLYIPSSGSWYDSDGHSAYTNDSPESLFTTTTSRTTPPRSPGSRQYGSMLLPKLRQQDQVTEPSAGYGPVRHGKRSVSATPNFQATVYPYTLQHPKIHCRGISPTKDTDSLTPASALYSATSSHSINLPVMDPALTSPVSMEHHSRRSSLAPGQSVRSSSAGPIPQHMRNISVSSLDEATIGRYGYPTYRNTPTYVTSATVAPAATMTHNEAHNMAYTNIPTIIDEFSFNHMAYPTALTHDISFPTPATSQTNLTHMPVSTMSYLTAQNPSPSLVRRVNSGQRLTVPHFWFDVRNLRQWKDFSMAAVTSVPDLYRLLQTSVDGSFLPMPPRFANAAPENEFQLRDILDSHFSTKINAALRITQGSARHMIMRSSKGCTAANGASPPDFISNYPHDAERTFSGEVKGRVVGLVKAYDEWNTGMRTGTAPKKVEYLKGLAHLHRLMREHHCRYGFIITEIELLCVRAGGLDSGEAPVDGLFDASTTPLFGYLEVAAPIQLSSYDACDGTSETPLTAALALWYLHMLAKDEPLPGVGPWRLDIGGPVARTRAHAVERDAWIPKPSLLEKREAKRTRGWIWPEDPYHRKESGGKKRGRA